jgi:CheY-like chemotaxis protein
MRVHLTLTARAYADGARRPRSHRIDMQCFAAGSLRYTLMMRVLVADDSSLFLAAVAEVIAASEGFELDALAESGEEAVELAAARRPDLALVDVHMPGIGGREAARRIAAASPETAVVLMTATPDDLTPPEALDKRDLSPAVLAEIRDGLTARPQPAARAGGR